MTDSAIQASTQSLEAPPNDALEELEALLTQDSDPPITAEDSALLVPIGKRYSTILAMQEVGYAVDLADLFSAQLEDYGVTAEVHARLRALPEELNPLERRYLQLSQAQMAATQRLEASMQSGLDLIAQSRSLSERALGKGSAALNALPTRTQARASSGDMVKSLISVAGFLKQYLAKMIKARMPADLPGRLELQSELVSRCNLLQEKLIAMVGRANDRLSYARGESYQLCGVVYSAGKSVYRRDKTRYGDFCYQYMKSKKSNTPVDPEKAAQRKLEAEQKAAARATRLAEARAARAAAKAAQSAARKAGKVALPAPAGEAKPADPARGTNANTSGLAAGAATGSSPGAPTGAPTASPTGSAAGAITAGGGAGVAIPVRSIPITPPAEVAAAGSASP